MICSNCNTYFDSDRDDAEARATAERKHGISADQMEVVCDNCNNLATQKRLMDMATEFVEQMFPPGRKLDTIDVMTALLFVMSREVGRLESEIEQLRADTHG